MAVRELEAYRIRGHENRRLSFVNCKSLLAAVEQDGCDVECFRAVGTNALECVLRNASS